MAMSSMARGMLMLSLATMEASTEAMVDMVDIAMARGRLMLSLATMEASTEAMVDMVDTAMARGMLMLSLATMEASMEAMVVMVDTTMADNLVRWSLMICKIRQLFSLGLRMSRQNFDCSIKNPNDYLEYPSEIYFS